MAAQPEPPFGPRFDASWPTPARALVRQAIDRHGGWGLWRRLDAVTLCPRSLSGVLPAVKGHGRSFPLPRSITVFPQRTRVEFGEYPARGGRGVFSAGDVCLQDERGQISAESRDHRRHFRGLVRYQAWDALDALYFFGYAFASYTAVPFILPRLVFRKPCAAGGLRGVVVEYPAGAHVHSRVQRYLFDETGLVRRNDYVADIVGPIAPGAHAWEDYVTVSGLPVPTHRVVKPRLGGWRLPFPTALDARFSDVAVALS